MSVRSYIGLREAGNATAPFILGSPLVSPLVCLRRFDACLVLNCSGLLQQFWSGGVALSMGWVCDCSNLPVEMVHHISVDSFSAGQMCSSVRHFHMQHPSPIQATAIPHPGNIPKSNGNEVACAHQQTCLA
eukprot:4777234-Amphidinium_carterae.1